MFQFECTVPINRRFGQWSRVNGPNLSPTSIPVQLDRGISVEQIGDAMNVCLLNGDSTRGLKSVAQELVEQMGYFQPSLGKLFPGVFKATSFNADQSTLGKGNIFIGSHLNSATELLNSYNGDTVVSLTFESGNFANFDVYFAKQQESL